MTLDAIRRGEQAVVLGASVAGLLAARALSRAYARVLVLDRDALPDQPVPRKGVPQSFQPHICLVKGLECMESLVPGFRQALLDAGAREQRRNDWSFVFPGGPLKGYETEITTIGATRGLIEWVLRREVAATSNVSIRCGIDVDGLHWCASGGTVSGVRVHDRGNRGRHDTMQADLVVDATGRNSAVSRWLANAGFGQAPEEVVNSRISYSSCFFRRPGDAATMQNLLIQCRPPDNPRLGILMATENDRWQVLLGGSAGFTTPADHDAFLEWTRDLAEPDLYLALRAAEPVSPVRGFRIPETRWRRFEKMRHWPAGLVVVGDAVAAFNPLYGQGMSVAAMQAVALGDAVSQRPTSGWEQAFQREAARIVAWPWSMGSGEDLRWEGTCRNGAPARFGERLLHRYQDRLLVAATNDETVSRTFIETINLLHGSTALISPGMVARVLLHGSRATAGSMGPIADPAALGAPEKRTRIPA